MDCEHPPPSGSDDAATPVAGPKPIPCTPERQADRDAWYIAYDPDWRTVDVYEESRLLRSERTEGQVIGIMRDCAGNDRGSPFWTDAPPEGADAGADAIFAAVARARAAVEPDPPAPQLAPDGAAMTGLPAWIWIDDDWSTEVATDTAGPITVAVYAEPQKMTWTTPEGERVCDGPGVAWTETAWDDYKAQPIDSRGQGNPACTFLFENASTEQPGGVYDTTVSVTWSFWWTLNGGPEQQLGELDLTTDLPVEVGQVQAVRTD